MATDTKLHELVEAEATKAESEPEPSEEEEAAEEGEPSAPAEPGTPGEGEPAEPSEPVEPAPGEPPAPAEPSASVPSMEQLEELEKAQTTYVRKVEKVLGAEKTPPQCVHCQGTGFDFTGGASEPDYREHDKYRACADCDGLGKVLTGSHVAQHDLVNCPGCDGRGYQERLYEATQAPPVAATPEYGTPAWMGTPRP